MQELHDLVNYYEIFIKFMICFLGCYDQSFWQTFRQTKAAFKERKENQKAKTMGRELLLRF